MEKIKHVIIEDEIEMTFTLPQSMEEKIKDLLNFPELAFDDLDEIAREAFRGLLWKYNR